MGKITLKELAEKTGLSVSAVSLALNNRPGISPENRERVLQVADELGYQQRKVAPAPRRAREIAVLHLANQIISTHDQVFPALMSAIGNAAEAAGYTMRLLFRPGGKVLNPEALRSCAGALVLTKNFSSKETLADLQQLQASGLPMVLLDHYYPTLACDAVTIDNEQAIRTAFFWLWEHGYRRIALVSHTPDSPDYNAWNSTAREQAYLACAGEVKMPPALCRVQHPDERGSFVRWIQGQTAMPDAFLLTMDYLALHLLPVLPALSLRLGDNCAMIGVDNLPFCETTLPSLSSVETHCPERAAVAVRRLLARIRQPEAVPQHISVGTRLVLRQSSPARLPHPPGGSMGTEP